MVDFLNLFGTNLLVTIILLAVSVIPLYFTVKMMGDYVGFIEEMIVVLIAGGIPIVMGMLFNSYLKLISFICIILICMFFFKLRRMEGRAYLAYPVRGGVRHSLAAGYGAFGRVGDLRYVTIVK